MYWSRLLISLCFRSKPTCGPQPRTDDAPVKAKDDCKKSPRGTAAGISESSTTTQGCLLKTQQV